MVKTSSDWERVDFRDKDSIFSLFKKKGYSIGDDKPIDPTLVFGTNKNQIVNNIIELYQIVLHQDATKENLQIWLMVTTPEYHKKSWRSLITKTIIEWADAYVLFFTHDFSDFWISIIADDIIEEILFQSDNPSPKADRFITDLLNMRPLLDPEGLTASQLQAKHELTASKLADALLTKDETKVRLLFQRAGLCPDLHMELTICREDAPLKNATIIVQFSETSDKWILKNLAKIQGNFHNITKTDLYWIILIGNNDISYFSEQGELYSHLKYPENREDLIKLFTTLVACIDIRAAFNGTTFEAQFGPFSPFFIKAKYLMKKYLSDHEADLKIIRDEWEQYFGKVYQSGDINEELFIKHAYLSILVKNVLFSKYLPGKIVKNSQSFLELSEYFEKRGIEFLFNDFYAWANEIRDIQEDIFQALQNAQYESDDIFRVIYQDMVSPATRHALGEFYTPPELVKLMVDEVYEFGFVTLDPACGSGTFLIEIINRIKESGKSDREILGAISNLYGFDVNPIAVLVAKANILLHLEEFSTQILPINIFLTDSLKSIEKNYQSSLVWGLHEIFPLGNLENLIINERFFVQTGSYNYLSDFIKFLQFIDEKMMEIPKKNLLFSAFDEEFDYPWLDEQIQNTKKTYRDNIHQIISKINYLEEKKQNHIWLYLLYNSIGARLIRNKIDLIIGNPPWIVLHGIYSMDYKEYVKNLARNFEIMMGGKNASNTEISSIFFYQCRDLYLKQKGIIFFVVTAGIMSGDQHSKFRRFKGFKDIFVWQFDQDVFNIHNICLGMKKGQDEIKNRIQVNIFKFKCRIQNGNYFFEKGNPEIYVPYNYDEINCNDDLVMRLIPKHEIVNLLPRGKSYYYDKFYAGARLGPRPLLFISITEDQGKRIKLKPNLNFQLKKPFDFKPYEEAFVESEYIFKAVKSTELIPFQILGLFDIFLPVQRDNYNYDENKIKPLARKHFKLLCDLYNSHQKKGASITDFWERINYNGGLTNPNQRKRLKIVFPGAGGMIKAALIKGNIVIDDKLYYFATDVEFEAYYLMGVLNSKSITEDLKKRGATGAGGSLKNYHKKPLEYLIPKFDEKNPLHISIAEKAKEFEIKVTKIVTKWCSEELCRMQSKEERNSIKENRKKRNFSLVDVEIRPQTIQNLVLQELDNDFNILDEYIIKLLVKNSN